MALPAATAWDVRTTGDDTNGGGFVEGASGTDYSQQDAAQVTYTDIACSNAPNPHIISSALNPFTSAHVGNVINITGGANFTPGRYAILSVNAGAATMDSAPGLAGATGGSGKLGGSLATVEKGVELCVGGMKCFVKGTHQLTVGMDIPGGHGGSLFRVIGYTTTHGDNGRATIQLNANDLILCTWGSGNDTAGVVWENFVFDGNNKTGSRGFYFEENRCGFTFYNCVFMNFKGDYCCNAVKTAVTLYDCEIKDNLFTDAEKACFVIPDDELRALYIVHRCYFTNNGGEDGACIRVSKGRLSVTNSIFYNNADDTEAIDYAGMGIIRNNVFHGHDGAGILIGDNGDYLYSGVVENNIFTDNVVGIYAVALGDATVQSIRNNAYYDNTDDTFGFTEIDPISLSGSPYVNAGSDFSLNSTAGAGLACQAAGMPGTIGLTSVVATGYPDVGAVQQDATAPSPVTTAHTFVG